jgi:single-stranded-DNA-specific exonuclease
MSSPTPPAVTKRWLPPAPLTPEINNALAKYDPVTRQLLFNRNLQTAAEAESFLNALPPVNDDPFQLAGLGEAVERLERAIAKRESIAVYGDYDTDGVTSTALLVQVLRALGAEVREWP